MLQQITDNFEKECEKAPDDIMVRAICDHVIEKLSGAEEQTLKNILDKNLTIGGAINSMYKAALKRKTGRYALLSDKEGFRIVDSYFGTTDSGAAPEASAKAVSLFDLI